MTGRAVGFVGLVERLRPTMVATRWLKADRWLKREPMQLARLVEAEHPGIAAMLRRAAAAFPDARWDAGPSNWMEREDGTLILTDPLRYRLEDRALAA